MGVGKQTAEKSNQKTGKLTAKARGQLTLSRGVSDERGVGVDEDDDDG
jgi:hypothetical protein